LPKRKVDSPLFDEHGIKFERMRVKPIMNRRIITPILLILPLICIGYAVYRSTAEVIIMQEATRQVTYGEPQHGLTLGLCIFAGLSLLAGVLLLMDEWRRSGRDDVQTTTRVSNKVATNYPH
jgi:hypothetical protein